MMVVLQFHCNFDVIGGRIQVSHLPTLDGQDLPNLNQDLPNQDVSKIR